MKERTALSSNFSHLFFSCFDWLVQCLCGRLNLVCKRQSYSYLQLPIKTYRTASYAKLLSRSGCKLIA